VLNRKTNSPLQEKKKGNSRLFRPILLFHIPHLVLQAGVKRGVLGFHFKVYLSYFYHFLVLRSQRRTCNRNLDHTNLAYLTAIAAFGFVRGNVVR